MSVTFREIEKPEYSQMQDFLYNAVFVPLGVEPFPREIVFEPEVYIYIDGFGDKPGDLGVVAEKDGNIIGMAWTRIIPAYGHIDDETPELATSVLPEYRGCGVGTLLMNRLFDLLMCAYIFENTDIVRIFAEPYAFNAASCRVLEKAGFQFEGLLRQNAVKNEKIIDMKLYAIVKHQWAEAAK
jgi:RimJ/RimL family protein N-acetyltransferase